MVNLGQAAARLWQSCSSVGNVLQLKHMRPTAKQALEVVFVTSGAMLLGALDVDKVLDELLRRF